MDLPKAPILACSHHKSGAAYTVNTFKDLAKQLNLSLWMRFYEPENEPANWDICLHQHGRIFDLSRRINFRGWHCIRNPMALVFSATLYHQKCKEPWVDVPLSGFSSDTFWSASDGVLYNQIKDPQIDIERKVELMSGNYLHSYPPNLFPYESPYDFKGKTYRQFLESIPTMEEKLIFEMRTYSRGVINDMLNFPKDERFFDIRLEDISHDRKLVQLTEAFRFLGFSGQPLLAAVSVASNRCLWHIGFKKISGHATTGVSDEWRQWFVGDVLKEFRRLFGYAEKALGY